MIGEWIDVMTRLWGTIEDGRGGNILSYSAFDKNNWPKKIEKFPAVITYVTELVPSYGTGSPFHATWIGASEFHIMPDLSPEGIPVVESYFKKILEIALGNMKLKNTVASWTIMPPNGGIRHVHLEYADQPLHRGLLVNWTVVESLTGKIPVAA